MPPVFENVDKGDKDKDWESKTPEHSTPGETRILVNEVLCYLQNKTEVTDVEILVTICSYFYDSKTIFVAKQLLYDSVKSRERITLCRGPKKTQADALDIIKVLMELGSECAVHFVAENLANLPPLSLENYDSIRLLREMEDVHNTVRGFENNLLSTIQNVVKNVLAEENIQEHKNVVRSNDDPLEESNVETTQDDEVQDLSRSTIGVEDEATEDSSEDSDCDEQTSELSTPYEERPLNTATHHSTTGWTTTRPSHMQMQHQKSRKEMTNTANDKQRKLKNKTNYKSDARQNRVLLGNSTTSTLQAIQRPDKTKEKGVVIGSCKISTLKAVQRPENTRQKGTATKNRTSAAPKGDQRSTGPKKDDTTGKMCTGIFVSRLIPRTTQRQLTADVYNNTGHKINPLKIAVKFKNAYSSFYIPCSQRIRKDLMDAKIWPENTLVKEFYE